VNSIWLIGGALFLFGLWMVEVDGRWIAAGTLAWLALAFNSVVSARNQVDKAFASIDAMLKKRFDLIPNLVDSVHGYLEHESQVLADVTKLRSAAASGTPSAERAVALDAQSQQLLSKLVATAEAYPELKASDNFQQLQRALNEVEEQISAARRTYNAAVQHYNDSLQMVPTRWLAKWAGFAERPYFEIPEGETAAPDVGARLRSRRSS
jgi:LemA protein